MGLKRKSDYFLRLRSSERGFSLWTSAPVLWIWHFGSLVCLVPAFDGSIEDKAIRFFLPALADEFVGRQATESFESLGEVVSRDEVSEVYAELRVIVIVVALHGSFLMVRFMRSTCPLVQGWLGLVRR